MRYDKIAPGLLAALEHYREEGIESTFRWHSEILDLKRAKGTSEIPHLTTFIRCSEDIDVEHLAANGIQINQHQGRIRTASLPLTCLEPLSEEPTVEHIIPSHTLQLFTDVGKKKIHLPAFRSKYSNLYGKDVIIGIIDTGIDPHHSAFSGRILRIWDQTLQQGAGVQEGSYGEELEGNRIAQSNDPIGHGTHVAGIAAGGDSNFSGVAPKAKLVIVKLATPIKEDAVIDGISYIFRVAHENNCPAVINLSLGGHHDAHDGSDPVSDFINYKSGKGRIVCCAAGNEGSSNIHARLVVQDKTEHTVSFLVPSFSITELNGWYSGSDEIRIQIQSPGGQHTSEQPILRGQNYLKLYPLPEGEVEISTPGPRYNGDHQFLVRIKPAANHSSSPWLLRIYGTNIQNGQADIWISNSGPKLHASFTSNIDHTTKIGSPGTATDAITVAAYTSKVAWTDINGNQQSVNFTLDDIAHFSSPGPLRNGYPKPDVTAPGAVVVSCHSCVVAVNSSHLINSNYRVDYGTSMATPFITGVVALLLQRNPDLAPDDIKDLLHTNSQIPGQPQGVFNTKWGYGLINASGL